MAVSCFLQALGIDSYALLWLRYTGFLVLYHVGVGSELTMAALALHQVSRQPANPNKHRSAAERSNPAGRCGGHSRYDRHADASAYSVSQGDESQGGEERRVPAQIRRRQLLSVALPNAYNFAFDYYTACLVLMAVYLPGATALHKGIESSGLANPSETSWLAALCTVELKETLSVYYADQPNLTQGSLTCSST